MLKMQELDEQECFTGIAPAQFLLVCLLPINLQPLGNICPQNTTLIMDKYGKCFTNPDSKWLIQIFGKTVFQTITNRVISGEISVQRRYIFIMIGGNQVQSNEDTCAS